MVKYGIIANLRFERKKDMDTVKLSIPDTSLKPTWGEKKIMESINNIMDNKWLHIGIKFENEADMDDHFNAIKGIIDTSKALKDSKLQAYFCHHDKLPFRPCVIKEEHMISDVSKG